MTDSSSSLWTADMFAPGRCLIGRTVAALGVVTSLAACRNLRFCVHAEPGTAIRGRVTSRATGKAIAGAVASIECGPEVMRADRLITEGRMTTDEHGQLFLGEIALGVPPGCDVSVSEPGHETAKRKVADLCSHRVENDQPVMTSALS